MTFSEMLDAAWEMAQGACKDLEVQAGVTAYRYPRENGGEYMQQLRYTINVRNVKEQCYATCVAEKTPEHALQAMRRELPLSYSAPQKLVDDVDAHTLPTKLPYLVHVTLTGWCGEMPLKDPIELGFAPDVGSTLEAPLSGGGIVMAEVESVRERGAGEFYVKAAVKGIKHLPGLNEQSPQARE